VSSFVKAEQHTYQFTPNLQKALTVEPPATVIFETLDALGGQVKSEKDVLTSLDFSRVNPATGPVFINGAQPGETLAVTIKRIEVPESGVIVTGKDMGVLGTEFTSYATKILRIEKGFVLFNNLKLPVSSMVGVIGVAPDRGVYETGTAHRHGGNMDTKEITENATVYLPIFQQGAFLALGDVHAVMGDGEVCVSACEIAARVTVEIAVIEDVKIPWPIVENELGLSLIVSLPSIEEALKEATHQAVQFLAERLKISVEEAYMLASLAVDIRISQLVDPNKTAKAFLPRYLVGDFVPSEKIFPS
jgi:amidase